MKKRKRKAGRNNRKPVQEKRTDLERKDLDMEGSRIAEYTRKTKETDISLTLELDGNGNADVDTGIGFFDHMLEGFARHGLFDLKAKVKGDLIVDCHHTIEDTGIVLGSAIKEAVGDKKGLKRFGSCILPMDETLVLCALDLSGRPYLSFEAEFTTDRVGYMDTEMVKEFFYAISYSAGMNLHMKVLTPGNNHHMIEAMFKAFAKALDEATLIDPRITSILSTKGSL
jgi:imidazoleglycerol-phosphate dehydratase